MSEWKMDVSAYLERIGAAYPSELTPAYLSALTRAHLERVPFETLELTEAHTEPSLEPEALYHKIVECRRGGYCFELNKLFYLLLKALGFSCYPIGARVLMGRPEPRQISHRGIVVTFDSGKWYCDVGFGGRGPKGILSLDEPGIQTLTYERFRVIREDTDYVVIHVGDDAETRMLKFWDKPWLDVDFDILNGYYAHHSHSPFCQKRILYLCRPDGWISLVGDTYTSFVKGELSTLRVDSEKQIRQMAAAEFGLNIPQWD